MKSRPVAIACMLCVAMHVFGFRASAQTGVAGEFKQIVSDLRQQGTSMSPDQYVPTAERALLDFSTRYPNAPEGALAHLYLGSIYMSVNSHEKAVRQFEVYLRAPVQKQPNEVAQAKYFMGTSYIALDRYDEAERVLREIVNDGGKAGRQISQMASSDLSRLGTLRKLKTGNPAVEISAVSSQGKRVKLADYRGKVVLLDFWAAWCMPCRMEMPSVLKVYGELHNKGFDIIGVSLDSDRNQFESFVKTNGMKWPQIFDGKGWQSEVGRLYAVTSIPATFLIDKQGKIRYKNLRGDKLKLAVQELLREQ